MKKIFSIFCAVLLLAFITPVNGHTVQAKVNTHSNTHTINAKNDIILRATPDKHAKQLGTLKNNSEVKVISSSDGWSYIQAGSQKGYVYSNALVKKGAKDRDKDKDRDKTKDKGKIRYIQAKQDVILREKPNKNAKQIGTIKNHSKVTLYSSNKGWSYIEAGSQKGFVYSSILVANDPKTSTKDNKNVTGGLLPTAGKILTYSPSFEHKGTQTFEVFEQSGYFVLDPIDVKTMHRFSYYENSKFFTMGAYETDWTIFNITYPLKKNTTQTRNVPNYEDESNPQVIKTKILSTNTTIKTKAGTFENVVAIQFESKYIYYLAKGYGVIKIVDSKGNTTTELISVK